MDAFLFSDAWARACRDEINSSVAYREAATTWEDAVAFVMDTPQGARGVFVDLWHGECREARRVQDGDLDKAPYVIRGDGETWEAVLGGTLEPLGALMGGKLRLEKGSLGAIAFHIKSARELVACASRVREKRASGAYGAVESP